MAKDQDFENLNKKEKKEYLRNLKSSRDSNDKKMKLIVTAVILIGVLLAVAGLFFLSGSSAGKPKDIGEAIPVDPTNGRIHIDVGQPHAEYTSNPPTSGPHYNAPGFGPIECKVYTSEVADEGVIHNLEHGGIWISYKDKADSALAKDLRDSFGSDSKIVISPRERNDSKIAIAAWGRLLKMEELDKQKIKDFISVYKNHPNAPEPLAGCGTNHTQQ